MNRIVGTTLLAAALLTFVAAGPVAAQSDPAKVTRSTAADPGEYPAQVGLLIPGVADTFQAQFCGGTLIHADWVMTAAHCVVDNPQQPPNQPDVLAGTNNLGDGSGQRITVDMTIVHPGFDFPTNDLALLHLSSPAGATPARLAFPGHEVLEFADTGAWVTGWGGLSGDEGNQTFPTALQEGFVPVIDDAECDAQVQAHGDDLPDASYSTLVCAGIGTINSNPEEADACRGDSGGPLWAESPDGALRQIGIVSGGPTCGFSPTYYTSVISFIEFIEQATGRPLASFPDIVGNVLERQIERIVVFGVTTGVAGGLNYDPAGQVSRGQMATFIARSLNLTPVQNGPFSDVDGSGTHDGNINAVAQAGIAGGFEDGTFKPELLVTRAQMATFIARALGLTGLESGPFVDVADAQPHTPNINALAAAGIALVPPDNLYHPFNAVTRAQMAGFLSRAFFGG